ncbi:hypothetical protein [Vibrio mimicus]|uniref:hypothetical protein n=1 Tax=Vibrio mimicus TaxID=674 RepID=UPI00087829FD|nr:hypothetical protein [Vibrio mimicus]AOW82302.1 hypothetical protein VM_06030 [Vibrio mimicus]
MTESGRLANGHFAKGNKFSKGRPLGAINQLTKIMQDMEELGYSAGQALVRIASDNADTFSPELKAKADSKLLDAVVKLAPHEKPEIEVPTIKEIDDRITILLNLTLPNNFIVLPITEYERLKNLETKSIHPSHF